MGRLIERLQDSPVICAEGYLFELERRGYLQAGAFVPEVVLEHPDAVLQLHREHLRAGSDVMVAFTYYGHRDKLRIIGKEDLLEPLNKNALALAKQAAAEDESGRVLVAGNICNTNIYDPAAAEKTGREATAMFEEQIGWARDAGVDFILAETFSFHEEAMLALQACKRAGMEAVVNVVSHATGKLRDGPTPAESCKMLEDAGAEVVGMNCNRGPATMWPLLVEIRQAVACEVAAIPVPFRTNSETPTFQSLRDSEGESFLPAGMRAFPVAIDARVCTRYEMGDFARRCVDDGIRFVGVCCGGGPHHVRSMAEALGRRPPASRYSPDMSKHYALGDNSALKQSNRDFLAKL